MASIARQHMAISFGGTRKGKWVMCSGLESLSEPTFNLNIRRHTCVNRHYVHMTLNLAG